MGEHGGEFLFVALEAVKKAAGVEFTLLRHWISGVVGFSRMFTRTKKTPERKRQNQNFSMLILSMLQI
jgi:hypothetical protein